MLELRWGFVPTEVREVLRPMVLGYLWLLPPWLQRLDIRYETISEHGGLTAALMSVSPRYREATMYIYGPWVASATRCREQIVLHELLHIPSSPVLAAAKEVVGHLSESGSAARAMASEMMEQASEEMTQDLTFRLFGVYRDPPPIVELEDEPDPTKQMLADRRAAAGR